MRFKTNDVPSKGIAAGGYTCRAAYLGNPVVLSAGFHAAVSIDDRYIIDLANRTAKPAVKFNGSQHVDQVAYDDERTAYLEMQGWRVNRLWNNEVLDNPQGAAEHILLVAAGCLGGTHPQSLPSREGRKRTPRYR